jgi:hypothetical protein
MTRDEAEKIVDRLIATGYITAGVRECAIMGQDAMTDEQREA